MEFLYEVVVLGYLTNGNRFCCPQYSIKPDSGQGDWRCPDFVVLDFDTPQVIVAEVTTAWNLGNFAVKAKELYDEGRGRIRNELALRAKRTIPNLADWPINLHLFVRDDRRTDLEHRIKKLGFQAEVTTLERAFQHWKP